MNLPGVQAFGRPVKPVAFFIALTAIIIAVFNILNVGIIGDSPWGDALAVFAGTTRMTLFAG